MPPATTFNTEQAVALTGATASQIDYFVRVAGIIDPAEPASRRGVPRRYDLWDLIEIRVAVVMLTAGIEAQEIGQALAVLRKHKRDLRNMATREQFAVLAAFRTSREALTGRTTVELGPPDMLREFAGYVIRVSVPMRWLIGDLEAQTGLLFGTR
jgi:hypothetical protein